MYGSGEEGREGGTGEEKAGREGEGREGGGERGRGGGEGGYGDSTHELAELDQ
jgi:hypothetical protein